MSNTNKRLTSNQNKQLYTIVSPRLVTFNPHNEVIKMCRFHQLSSVQAYSRAMNLAHIHMQVAVDVVADIFQERKSKWRKQNGTT